MHRRITGHAWRSACGTSTPGRGRSFWAQGFVDYNHRMWLHLRVMPRRGGQAGSASILAGKPCLQPRSRQGWRRSQGRQASQAGSASILAGKPCLSRAAARDGGAPRGWRQPSRERQHPCWQALPQPLLAAQGWRRSQAAAGAAQAGSASILAGKPCLSRAAARDGGAPRAGTGQAGSASILAGRPCRSRAAARDGGAPRGGARRAKPGAPASLLAGLAVAALPPGMAALPGAAAGQAGSASILAGRPCLSRAAARDGGAPRGAQPSRERQHPCWQALPQPRSRQGWRRSQGREPGKPGAPASLLASLATAVQPPGMAAVPGAGGPSQG